MVNGISTFSKIDNVCDYIPVVSTLSNITGLFQKYAVLPLMSKQSIGNSHYYKHLKNKSILRCIVLLIPVIGNIIVGIYDFANRKFNNRDITLAAVQRNGWALQFASTELKDDKDVVLAAVQKHGWALQFASTELKNDIDVVRIAYRNVGIAILELTSTEIAQSILNEKK